MDELIEYIKTNTNNIYDDIKIVSVVYNKELNSIEIKVVYKSSFNFTPELRENLCNVIKNFIGIPNLKVDLKTKKSLLDGGAIYELISYYMQKNYASIYATISKSDVEIIINNDLVDVTISLIEVFYNYLNNKNFETELKEFLERNYFQNFVCNLKVVNGKENLETQLNQYAKQFEEKVISEFSVPKIEFYEIENLKPFVGNKIETLKVPQLKFITSAEGGLTVAGTVEFLIKKSFTSKRKNQNGEFEQREFYNFTLNDGYGKLQCVYFPTKETLAKFEELKNGDKVVAFGDVEEYNQRLSLKVKGVSYCDIPEKKEEQVKQKFENENYVYIKPEPYVSMMQSNLFDIQANNTLEVLKNNDFVVFDLETTGLDASSCEIIEIGACKVHDGKITETFSCLIKPKEIIPKEITDLTGITNEMVKNCFSIKQVLQDFYKFTRNSVLVAHNISFDFRFVYLESIKQGYVFDNKQIDTLNMSRIRIPGLKNYKLGTVAKSLNVSLEGAHRAVNDATATAEVFIKIAYDNMLN